MDIAAIDLNRLRTFHLVARHNTLRAAAARLRITIPAVSSQIRHLERELSTKLFERRPNKMILTASGQRFAYEVSTVFARVEHALASLSTEHVAAAGQMTMSLGNDLSRYFTPIITAFIERYPALDLSISIHESPATAALVARGEVDIGVGYFSTIPRTLEKEIILSSSFSLVCRKEHPLMQQGAIRLQDLVKHKLLVLSRESTAGAMVQSPFTRAGLRPKRFIEFGNCHMAREFAERDIGAAIVHTVCVESQLSPKCARTDLDAMFGNVDIAAVYRRKTGLPGLQRQLLDALLSTGNANRFNV